MNTQEALRLWGEIERLENKVIALESALKNARALLTIAMAPEDDGEGCKSANVRQAAMLIDAVLASQPDADGRGNMAKYRKKPVVIEAEQWFPDAWAVEHGFVGIDKYGVEWTATQLGITTLEGFMRVTTGDWIITGVKGEKYPCKPDIFEATYEPVQPDADGRDG